MRDDRPRLPHHPGLDGIRGLAVAAVVAYHGGFAWAKGGYLGVSVFFTLSGFLITGLLLAEHDRSGHIGLGAFWGRRFRRLLPASIVALAGVCVFAVTVATPGQRRDVPGDVVAALAYVANWRFVLEDVSYADLFDEPSPVLHFWSLAIEEQLYLFLPLVVAGVLAVARGRRQVLGLVLVVLTAASVSVSFLLADGNIDRLYFGTDARAAELLIGAILALALAGRPEPLGRVAGGLTTLAGVGALGLLATAAVTVDQQSEWLYRGGFAAIAVTSAVALFAAARESRFGTVLGNPLLRWLGLRSYGIYLYHWPIFLWLDDTVIDLDDGPLFLVRIAVTAVAAELSYHLVEMPFRERRVPRPVRLVLAPATLGAVVVAVVAMGLTVPETEVVFEEASAQLPDPPSAPVVVEQHHLLVIGGELGGRLAHEMASRLESTDPVTLDDRTEARCVAPCADVEARWRTQASEADTVVVLVGPDDPLGGDAAALERVRASVPDESSVVWVSHPVVGPGINVSLTPATELVDRFDAANAVVAEVAAIHDDRVIDLSALIESSGEGERRPVSLDPDDAALSALLDAIAVDLLEVAHADAHTTRVLVVGDSLAQTLGAGLVAWGESSGEIVTWNTARAGCGLMREGEIEEFGVLPAGCADWAERYPRLLAEFRPDVVVVLSGPWDLSARRIDGSEFVAPGDPTFDAYMRSEYQLAIETLAAGGASIVWLSTPCVSPDRVEAIPGFEDDRRRHQRELVESLFAGTGTPGTLVDLDPVVCPQGAYDESVGGIAGARFDGIHFTVDAASWLAEHHLGDVISESVSAQGNARTATTR